MPTVRDDSPSRAELLSVVRRAVEGFTTTPNGAWPAWAVDGYLLLHRAGQRWPAGRWGPRGEPHDQEAYGAALNEMIMSAIRQAERERKGGEGCQQ